MMVAAGVGQTTPVSGSISRTDGATPKEQLMTAPAQTSIPMLSTLQRFKVVGVLFKNNSWQVKASSSFFSAESR